LSDHNASLIATDEATGVIRFQTLGESKLNQIKVASTSRINELILSQLTIPLPFSWTNNRISLVELDPIEPDYQEASDCFLQGFNAIILRIERVQNPDLYREYFKARQRLAEKYQGNANELLLKHGTLHTDPSLIWNSGDHTNTYGFDPRFAADKGKFGKGAYFAEDTSYSHRYAYSVPNTNDKQIF